MVATKTETKLFCTDSRKMSEIEDESIHLIITSPPYYDLKNYNENDNHENQLGNPENYDEYISSLNKVWKECIRTLCPDGKICINIMPIFLSGKETHFNRRVTRTVINDIENYMNSTEEMYLHSLYIWDKRKIARFSSFGSYPYPPNIFSTMPYEWIVVFAKKGKRKFDKDLKKKSKITTEEWQNWAINSIWEMQPEKAKFIGHPAPFPEELPRRLIKLYSFVGDTVLDPFIGSGTTAVAAKKLGRNAVGYEVNPEYIQIAKERLAQTNIESF
ncbi:DNA-methyltransferase [Methanolobus halotolerans]|uniref:Type II methyltransferase n=1 Tax=Methanolobus halotolerans TaxID=2052935 RepID=A0A4E0QX45_9EURY|nr:site-specific DNA-methyltransferase [Methanolobus halotolerans]TGC07014.1 site-specific DNA-methyltransferase [Methanolobus halotolerans]